MQGRLNSIEAAREFVLAGNAYLTLVSKRTQERFTYRVAACKDNEHLRFVSVLVGPDNRENYKYLGLVRDGRYSHGRKAAISADARSARAFEWFIRIMADNNQAAFDQVEVWHEGRCGRCGRTLTVPESIERGLGPECANKE